MVVSHDHVPGGTLAVSDAVRHDHVHDITGLTNPLHHVQDCFDYLEVFVEGLPVGYIIPWPDKENIPAGWRVVDRLGQVVADNPGNPRSSIVPGVWIRKVVLSGENPQILCDICDI